MAVLGDGSIRGTIGGGVVEGKAIEMAMELFEKEPATALVRRFTLSNTLAAASDMVCGGQLDVLLQRVTPDEQARVLFKTAARAVAQGHKVVLVTQFEVLQEKDKPEMRVSARWMASDKAPFRENMSEGLARMAREAADSSEARLFDYEGKRYLVEPQMESGTLILAGAGHVSQQTARVATLVGFRTIVIDDREEFANRERFADAAQVAVLDSFDDCFNHVAVDANSYIAILTRGHLHDKAVLAQALQTPAAYIGMIGSTRKRQQVYDALLEEGVSEESLAKVHCPIGLGIGAETPEEIAISIVAEIVRARALRRGATKRVS